MVSSIGHYQTIPPANTIHSDHQLSHENLYEKIGPEIADRVTISRQSKALSNSEKNIKPNITGEEELTEEGRKEVGRLKRTDRGVKAHERAHMAAGAGVVMGGANYEYEVGPDGKMYAVGGEVKIDTSREKDPEATIRKMQQVKRAALAPADPSGTDRSVAAQASQIEAQARIELAEQRKRGAEEKKDQPISSLINPITMTTNPIDFQEVGGNINITA